MLPDQSDFAGPANFPNSETSGGELPVPCASKAPIDGATGCSFGGEIDENPDRPRAHVGLRWPVRARGVRFWTKRGADRQARKLAPIAGVTHIRVFPTGRRRWEWECAWLQEVKPDAW